MIPQFPIHRKQLKNGLKIIVAPDNRLPVMNQYTLYRVGSRNESTNLTGISHLFEHMMFNGSKKFKRGEFDSILESHGGYSNAYTARDMTVYYESFPPEILELAMELNSDRMGWLDLNEDNLNSEREVVKEERRMRTDNSVSGSLDELLYSTAYSAHPYRWPIIGWMDDLNYISLKDCQAYFGSYYSPNNAILVFAGDCRPEEVFSLAESHYGRIASRTIPVGRFTKEPKQLGEKRSLIYKNTQVESCMIGYHGLSVENNENYALDILQIILGDGESSRLYQKLVYQKELAANVYVNYEWRIDPSLFMIFLKLNPDKRLQDVEPIVYDEIELVIKEGITDAELKKARIILKSSFIRGLKTSGGRANQLGSFEILFGECERLFTFLNNYEKITLEDIQSAAKNYLSATNRTVVYALPDIKSKS